MIQLAAINTPPLQATALIVLMRKCGSTATAFLFLVAEYEDTALQFSALTDFEVGIRNLSAD